MVIYSQKPMTLRQHIFVQRVSQGDYEAMHGLILERTNLSAEEAYELDDEDLMIVLGRVSENLAQGIVLQKLGQSLNERNDKV